MSMRIFDTNVLIDYLKNKPEAVDFLKQCVREGDQLACSVITVAELLTGIRPGEKEVIMRFLHAFEALDITYEIALLAGAYMCQYRGKNALSLADALLAATANVHHAAFSTLNTKHFPMSDISMSRPY